MKKLVLGALLAAAASSTACTSASTEAVITANWSFEKVNGTVSGQCDPNYPTTSIYSQPWDPINNVLIGQPIIDKFDCAAGHGTTDPLDGLFLVWIQMENDSGSKVLIKSKETYIDTADGDLALDFPILSDGGYFFLTWDLVDAQTSAPLTCKQAGISRNGSVETIATIVGTTFMLTDKFTCEAGYGTTAPLLAGTYSVSVDAEEGNQAVGTAPTLINKQITAPEGLTDLGHILIPID
jgi:hypothetical protein